MTTSTRMDEREQEDEAYLRSLLDDLGNAEVQVAACYQLKADGIRSGADYERRCSMRDEAANRVVAYFQELAALRPAPSGDTRERVLVAFQKQFKADQQYSGTTICSWLVRALSSEEAPSERYFVEYGRLTHEVSKVAYEATKESADVRKWKQSAAPSEGKYEWRDVAAYFLGDCVDAMTPDEARAEAIRRALAAPSGERERLAVAIVDRLQLDEHWEDPDGMPLATLIRAYRALTPDSPKRVVGEEVEG